jgi:hypothetical protein
LYGLKQDPRVWYIWLSDYLVSIGFHSSKLDTSLFKTFLGAEIFYLLVYVDDILLIGNNSDMFHQWIQLLNSKFKFQDLGIVYYFLGIEVHPTSLSIMLRQDKYILDILHRVGMSSCKHVNTLISTSMVIVVSDCLFYNPTCFRQIVDAHQYLNFTRPDIYFYLEIKIIDNVSYKEMSGFI